MVPSLNVIGSALSLSILIAVGPAWSQSDLQVVREQLISLKPGHVAEMTPKFRDSARRASQENGAIEYRAFFNADDPRKLKIMEHWKDVDSWKEHMKQGYLQEFRPLDAPAYSREAVTLREFTASTATSRQAKPVQHEAEYGSCLIREVRLILKPGVKREEFESALAELASKIRAEPGNLGYRAFEVVDSPGASAKSPTETGAATEIVEIAEWAGEKSLNKHKSAPARLEFVKKHENDYERESAVTWKEL